MMRFYTGQHRFYCGIDLHARLLAVCVLDQAGTIVYQKQLPAEPRALLEALAPFRPDVAIAVECMFAWYWVADLCATEQIPFLLGHALYMKAIHGGKSKNDDIDAEKIARLLRGGNLPIAYVYPKGMRETRDLLHQAAGLRGGPGPVPTPRDRSPEAGPQPRSGTPTQSAALLKSTRSVRLSWRPN